METENKGNKTPEEKIRCENCMSPLKEEIQAARTQEREKLIREIEEQKRKVCTPAPAQNLDKLTRWGEGYEKACNDILKGLKKEKGE